MRTFVTLITAAAFLLHFTLGCCAHHAHAAEGTNCCNRATVTEHEHVCQEHAGHCHAESEHESQPHEPSPADSECPGHHCHDGHCGVMVSAKTVIEKDTFQAVLPLFAADTATHTSISPRTAAAIDSGGLFAPCVRKHLFNQVLLN